MYELYAKPGTDQLFSSILGQVWAHDLSGSLVIVTCRHNLGAWKEELDELATTRTKTPAVHHAVTGGALSLYTATDSMLNRIASVYRMDHNAQVEGELDRLAAALKNAGGVIVCIHSKCPDFAARYGRNGGIDPCEEARFLDTVLRGAGSQVAKLATAIGRDDLPVWTANLRLCDKGEARWVRIDPVNYGTVAGRPALTSANIRH